MAPLSTIAGAVPGWECVVRRDDPSDMSVPLPAESSHDGVGRVPTVHGVMVKRRDETPHDRGDHEGA